MRASVAFQNCTMGVDTAGTAGPGWDHLGVGYVVTHFADGTRTDARPHRSPEYRAHAAKAGYGLHDRACTGYALEHELAHMVVAEALGQPYSATLWQDAHRPPDAPPYTRAEIDTVIVPEERLVRAAQRYFNTGHVSPALQPLHAAGVRLVTLAAAWDALIVATFGARRWWEGAA